MTGSMKGKRGSAAAVILAAALMICLTIVCPRAAVAGDAELKLTSGQVVYVPAYTWVYYTEKGRTFPLTTTLVIHNTDQDTGIRVNSIRFHDAEGALVREFAEEPRELAPFAALDVLVAKPGKTKGSGTCFVVTWMASQPVSAPIIECILIGASGQQGISLRTHGRVVRELKPVK